MIPRSRSLAVWCSCAVLSLHAATLQASSYVVTFSDLTLPANSYYLGPDGNPAAGTGTTSAWTSAAGQASFQHYYDAEYFSWAGFSYSNGADATTAGYGNQQSAHPGGGAAANGSVEAGANFALGYHDSFNGILPTVTLGTGEYLTGMHVANTTYSYLYMLSGLDGFLDNPANRFGGTLGTDPDYLLLTARGYDAGNTLVGTVDYYLADFRSSNPAEDFIRTGWSWLDLSSLGTSAQKVTFSLTSSDAFAPTYFAADNLNVAPEPSRMLLLLGGLLTLLNRRSRPSLHA